ncbi:hypothetical protein [Nonomuraea sp. NPDC050783]|uniref:hypothetical protein n=1 Tax=Nonomuraea sp. NPDC050783 TaxID=3154634 RepID=UPI003466862A
MGTYKEPRSSLFRELIEQGVERGVEQGIEQGIQRGIAQGEAEAILLVLRTRGLPVSEQAEERIRACEDRELLLSWVAKAVTVESADQLFE